MAAASASAAAGPSVGAGPDRTKMRKLANKIEDILSTKTLNKEPRQLDPESVLVAPRNRDGAPPNIQHLHQGILKSFVTKGFDASRPQVGICVQFSSASGKHELLEHNRRFSKGVPLLPPINEEKALYGSLAGSHFNLALRILKCGSASTVLGDVVSLLADSPSLDEVTKLGHRWWILPESICLADQVDISLWRNQDQNENQGINEIEVLQTITTSAKELVEKNKKTNLGELAALAGRRIPARITGYVMQTLVKYYTQFLSGGDQHLVDELVDFHSTMVNPRELTVSNAFFVTLSSDKALSQAPYLRHYLLLTQYTTEKARAAVGGPALAAFVDTKVMEALCKKTDQIREVENKVRELRTRLLPALELFMGAKQARVELAGYLILVVRALLGKPWPEDLAKDLEKVTKSRKFSVGLIDSLGAIWAKQVDLKFQAPFAAAAGFPQGPLEDPDSLEEVNLENLRTLKRSESDGAPEPPTQFQRGDLVTVVRRMSWTIPGGSRRDIGEGTEGTIEGFADSEHRQVLVKVTIMVANKPLEVTHQVYPRNLKLTSEYRLSQAAVQEAAAAEEPPTSSSSVPAWALLGSEPDQMKPEPKWEKYLSNQELPNQLFWFKGRVAVCLEALNEVVPSYTSKDLALFHRQTAKGGWKDELWTLRDFAAQELVFAPLTPQLRETGLANHAANALLGIPKHGLGRHPENQALSLDGRARVQLAGAGNLDDLVHSGLLFFIVRRTTTAEEANMSFETCLFEHRTTLEMPLKKRKHTVDRESKHLPTIPLLVNKKAIKAHQRLTVFAAEPKKAEKKEGEKKEGEKKEGEKKEGEKKEAGN